MNKLNIAVCAFLTIASLTAILIGAPTVSVSQSKSVLRVNQSVPPAQALAIRRMCLGYEIRVGDQLAVTSVLPIDEHNTYQDRLLQVSRIAGRVAKQANSSALIINSQIQFCQAAPNPTATPCPGGSDVSVPSCNACVTPGQGGRACDTACANSGDAAERTCCNTVYPNGSTGRRACCPLADGVIGATGMCIAA